MQERKAVSNVQLGLLVMNKNFACPYGTSCTNQPSWSARVYYDALDTRDKPGREPCMQRIAAVSNGTWVTRKSVANMLGSR